MRKTILFVLTGFLVCSIPAEAGWIWTPDVGKWMNTKQAAKDTPEEQLAWAMEFFNNKDWDRAIEEFQKLPDVFPNSRLAAEGVYHAGLAFEEKGDLGKAADSYQKLVDKYPYSDRIKDAMRREFEIANKFASGEKLKVLGVPALAGGDKALELYKHIVKNAPFGTFGDQAQYQIGELLKKTGEFEEAQRAFQAVIDEYPGSEFAPKAKFQIGECAMLASKRGPYNEQSAERAIEQFEGYKREFPSDAQAIEAEESIKTLRAKKALTTLETAQFYEKQGKLKSARVYYQEIVSKYPDTQYAEIARRKATELVRAENQEAKPKKFLIW